jgi:prepilin-type N-terminal cleavage/methylation domain-containing protein
MASRRVSIRNKNSGFSLIEILIVLGIFAFVAALTLFVSLDVYRGDSFHAEEDRLFTSLEKARSQAISNMCFGPGCTDGKPHGVHFATTQYTIFQGASWATRDTALDEVVPIQSKTITVTGFTDVLFIQLVGTATFNPAGSNTLLLKDTAGKDVSTIYVTSEGRLCTDDPSC